jgi:hydrogenase maturation protease
MNVKYSTMVAGVGSDVGDDCAGIVAARQLAAKTGPFRVEVIRHPAALLDRLEGVDRLHVIDACRGLNADQPMLRCDWPAEELESIRFAGTHDMDLTMVLSLAEQLGLLPRRTTVWCIAAFDSAALDAFANASLGTKSAIDLVVQAISNEAVAETASEACRHA